MTYFYQYTSLFLFSSHHNHQNISNAYFAICKLQIKIFQKCKHFKIPQRETVMLAGEKRREFSNYSFKTLTKDKKIVSSSQLLQYMKVNKCWWWTMLNSVWNSKNSSTHTKHANLPRNGTARYFWEREKTSSNFHYWVESKNFSSLLLKLL